MIRNWLGAILTLILLAMPALAVDIPAGSSVGAVPATPGNGLKGSYWQLNPKEMGETATAIKDVGVPIMNTRVPTATFISTGINYTGDDLTPIGTWLGPDGGSIVGGNPATNNLDDGLFHFTGYLAVAAAGKVDYFMGSDDGSILKIGGLTVIDNDGSHGAPGNAPTGSATFTAAGLYPLEVTYFNGDWTDGAGAHGGANVAWRQGASDTAPAVSGSLLYTVPEPTSLALLGLGSSFAFLLARRRRDS